MSYVKLREDNFKRLDEFINDFKSESPNSYDHNIEFYHLAMKVREEIYSYSRELHYEMEALSKKNNDLKIEQQELAHLKEDPNIKNFLISKKLEQETFFLKKDNEKLRNIEKAHRAHINNLLLEIKNLKQKLDNANPSNFSKNINKNQLKRKRY